MKTFIAILGVSMASLGAFAQEPPVLVDPWVPPEVRKAAAAEGPSAQGATLRAEIEQRLRAPFECAARDGLLTREQAAASGLGFIARHFDAIDRSRVGTIRFEDYKRFLKERGALLD
jgi:hypothetical protein